MRISSLSAIFPSAEQAQRAAQELEMRGAGPSRIETRVSSVALEAHKSSRSHWIALCAAGGCGLFLALATLCVPGVGYVLALVALVTIVRVRPTEIEHRLLVRDQVLATGGAVLSVLPGALRTQAVVRLLQRYGAIDVHENR